MGDETPVVPMDIIWMAINVVTTCKRAEESLLSHRERLQEDLHNVNDEIAATREKHDAVESWLDSIAPDWREIANTSRRVDA